MKTLFALDYDDTYTRDPDLWLAIIDMILAKGHDMVVATMRCSWEREDMDPRLLEKLAVQFCCGKAKKPFLARMGLYPHIWIDDNPKWIDNDE